MKIQTKTQRHFRMPCIVKRSKNRLCYVYCAESQRKIDNTHLKKKEY